MRLRELVGMPDLRLAVTAAPATLDVALTGVFTTDALPPGRELAGGELVLAGLTWRRTAADSEAFVRHLAEHRVAALATWPATGGQLPPDLVEACRRHALPLLAVVPDVSSGTIAERVRAGLRPVAGQLERQQADRLLAVLDAGRAARADTADLDGSLRACGLVAGAPLAVVSATRPGAGAEPEMLRTVVDDVLAQVAKAPVVAAAPDGEVVAFVTAEPADLAPLLEHLRLTRAFARGRLCLGVSGPGDSPGALLDEARQARRVSECSTAPVSVTGRDEVDSHVVLLAGLPASLRTAYHQRLLRPLLAYDAGHRTELLRTLECFLEHSGSWSVAAQRLHLHVNTLRYRIGRIEQLTGRDLSRLEHQVDLFLALRARG